MNRKQDRTTGIKSRVPSHSGGRQELNRRSRRMAASHFRRAGISADPLTAFLASRRGMLSTLGGILVFAAILLSISLARM
jgi:hypothetical protein